MGFFSRPLLPLPAPGERGMTIWTWGAGTISIDDIRVRHHNKVSTRMLGRGSRRSYRLPQGKVWPAMTFPPPTRERMGLAIPPRQIDPLLVEYSKQLEEALF